MIDKEKITTDYENLKKVQYTQLIPLEKVLALEEAKEKLETEYLSKISKIISKNNKYTLVTESGFTLFDLLDVGSTFFGDMNFVDKNNDNGKISIDIAYTYGIIGMLYEDNKFKYSVTVFWDI